MDNIGRYQVVRELGRGAMGVVYLAQHPTLNRLVAIKTFRTPDGDENDWDNRARLLAEADRACNLKHQNIVSIYNVEDRTEPPYIEMEYVDGPTLDQLLTTSPPDMELTIAILRQAADALDYAHGQGIIHRDIKPANLMLDSNNTVKITDFGIAKRAGTNTGTTSRFMGTPDYMSPEQLDGRPDVDGRADQFALATVAYQLVTGRKPFEADTVTAVSHMIANKDPLPPSHINRKLSRQVDAAIGKALSKSRERRFSTCAEFAAALEMALLAPPRRGIPPWAPIAAALVLLGALVLVGSKFGWFGSEAPAVVAVTPGSAVLYPSQSQQFSASGASVKWSVSPDVGSISEDGLYTAPAHNAAERTVTLTATAADGAARATVDVRLLPAPSPPPRELTVSPASAVLMPGESRQFVASPPDVRWSVTPDVGSISPAGVYRAPVNNSIEQKVRLTATGKTDGTQRAFAEISLLAERRPTPPQVTYSLQPLSREIPIPNRAVFGENDDRLGYLGIGQLRCRVKASGPPSSNPSGLRLVWFVNGDEMSNRPVTLAQGEEILEYRNQPEPGVYRIKLMSGAATRAETTFTIQRTPK